MAALGVATATDARSRKNLARPGSGTNLSKARSSLNHPAIQLGKKTMMDNQENLVPQWLECDACRLPWRLLMSKDTWNQFQASDGAASKFLDDIICPGCSKRDGHTLVDPPTARVPARSSQHPKSRPPRKRSRRRRVGKATPAKPIRGDVLRCPRCEGELTLKRKSQPTRFVLACDSYTSCRYEWEPNQQSALTASST